MMVATPSILTMDRRPAASDTYGNVMPQTPPSANISPTSMHSHLHVRQLRPQKQPLYTPACLRPTEPLSRPQDIPERPRAPDTPPQSKESSFDSAKSRSGVMSPGGAYVTSPSASEPGTRQFEIDPFSDEVEESISVTGPPTSAHWKPDSSSASCTVCKTPFTWYFRRHHCRRCGDVVCASHLLHTVPLDQNARLHSRGTPSKACDPCYLEWRKIKALRHSRANSLALSNDSSQTLQSPLAIPQQAKHLQIQHVGSMARSEGMVWSTF